MKALGVMVLALWVTAAVAGAGEATQPSTATPPAPKPTRAVATYVVAELKIPLRYGNDQIGELPEGTELQLIRKAGQWVQVRVEFGDAWVTGWVNAALIAPDSLKAVGIDVGRGTQQHSFERRSLPGFQFLIVPVRFTPGRESPSRVYLRWGEVATADIYVVHSRDKRVAPYGYLRRKDMSEQRTFETEEKRQILNLTPGQPRVETYVFAVPTRARRFLLAIKDVRQPVRLR